MDLLSSVEVYRVVIPSAMKLRIQGEFHKWKTQPGIVNSSKTYQHATLLPNSKHRVFDFIRPKYTTGDYWSKYLE